MSSKSTYVLARNKISGQTHCVSKFAPTYGPLHWSQTWDQLHITSFDRVIIDLNWKIAHSVLYTGDRLANRFKMSHVDANCFCRADVETLEHLFFECELARLLVGWVYFNLMQVDPVATPFSVVELLFGFSLERRRSIPLVIICMLHVMKHVIWVARCDFRFRDVMPVASECLKKAIAKIKFILCLQARKCKSPSQFRSYEREWLARGTLGHFEGEELVFSF